MLYNFGSQMAQEIIDDLTQNTDLLWYINEHLEYFTEEVISSIGEGIESYVAEVVAEMHEALKNE